MFGTPDNFDTEYTEHQHIADAKDAYKRTNKINSVQQITKHIERRTALQLKFQYLDSLGTSQEEDITETASYQPSVGSRVPGLMHISIAESTFRLKDLEYCLRSYLHDLSFPHGGRKHRIKRHKLPQLYNLQVLSVFDPKLTRVVLHI